MGWRYFTLSFESGRWVVVRWNLPDPIELHKVPIVREYKLLVKFIDIIPILTLYRFLKSLKNVLSKNLEYRNTFKGISRSDRELYADVIECNFMKVYISPVLFDNIKLLYLCVLASNACEWKFCTTKLNIIMFWTPSSILSLTGLIWGFTKK